jgi:ABC-type multidrug transport system fused ATPase/permease subunit
VSFCTFATLTLVAKEELTPSKAFTGLALFNTLKSPLQIFPDIIVRIEEALVSLRRISSFLSKADLDDFALAGTSSNRSKIGFPKNSSFAHHESHGPNPFHLDDINVTFPEGGLSLIIGPTGSGKTSLILSLIGEMKCLRGGSTLRTIYPEVAYVSQTVWLLNATIRENILFGEPFDEVKYLQVIQCCSLLIDFQNLPGGDSTEVGEAGVNLS